MGDLGTSIIQNADVAKIIGERLWPSLYLLLASALLAVMIALPLSVLAARHSDQPVDHIIRLAGIVGFAMPPFWVGILLMLLFGIGLDWFPISGFGKTFLDRLHHLFLPALTIALFLAPILVQSLRSAMLDVMTSEYIEVARAKGLGPWRILVKHALRNALIPVTTILAVNIGWLLSGAVVVEYLFSFPGLGSLLVRAVGYRDYPVIQGLSLVFAVLVMVVNLLADLSYMLIDRRVMKACIEVMTLLTQAVTLPQRVSGELARWPATLMLGHSHTRGYRSGGPLRTGPDTLRSLQSGSRQRPATAELDTSLRHR